MLNNIKQAKSVAKRLKKNIVSPEPIKLSKAQAITARVYGFKDWHHLDKCLKNGSPLPETPDIVKILKSELLDLAATNDAKFLCKRIFPDFRMIIEEEKDDRRGWIIETPTLKYVKDAVFNCKPGKFILLQGEPDIGKKSIAATIAKRANSPDEWILCGGLRVDLALLGSIREIADSFYWGMKFTYLPRISNAKALERVTKHIQELMPKAIVITGFETISGWPDDRKKGAIQFITELIKNTECKWLITSDDCIEDLDYHKSATSLISQIGEKSGLLEEGVIMPSHTADSDDLFALVDAYIGGIRGLERHDLVCKNLLAKILIGALDTSTYSVLSLIDDAEIIYRKPKPIPFDQTLEEFFLVALDQAILDIRSRKERSEELAEIYSDDLRNSQNPRVKFPLLSIDKILAEPIIDWESRAEGIMYFKKHQDIMFSTNIKQPYDHWPDQGTITVLAQNNKKEPTALFSPRDGVLTSRSHGHNCALEMDFSFEKTNTDESICFADDQMIQAFLDKTVTPMLKPKNSNLDAGKSRELRTILELIIDASVGMYGEIGFGTPIHKPTLGIWGKELAINIPKDILDGLLKMIEKDYDPIGWGYVKEESHKIAPLISTFTRSRPRPRLDYEKITERANRRLPNASDSLKLAIADVSNVSLKAW